MSSYSYISYNTSCGVFSQPFLQMQHHQMLTTPRTSRHSILIHIQVSKVCFKVLKANPDDKEQLELILQNICESIKNHYIHYETAL